MIAVQMREDDGIDAVRIDALPFQRRQCRRATIDQQRSLRRLQEKTGVEPSPGAEGVTRTYDVSFIDSGSSL